MPFVPHIESKGGRVSHMLHERDRHREEGLVTCHIGERERGISCHKTPSEGESEMKGGREGESITCHE